MKSKKIISVVLTFVLVFSLIAVMPAANAAGDTVKLIYAKAVGGDWITENGVIKCLISASGYVEVKNIAYSKSVTIHYSDNGGTTWKDVQASYHKPTNSGYEAWKFTLPEVKVTHGSTAVFQFAIKYQVNGQTYWDNNSGDNYSVNYGYGTTMPTKMAFGSGKLALQTASAYQCAAEFYGNIQLVNLGYQKDVKVRYTTDNWATYQEAPATYQSSIETPYSDQDIEEWTFWVDIGYAATEVKFAISYTVNGKTYWDNNFGANYSVMTNGGTI